MVSCRAVSGSLTKSGPAAREEVALAELDAARPKDGVSARDVKEGVGNHPADQILQPLEFERAVAGRHLDVAILGAFERARRHTLDEIDRARNARAQLLEGLLRVLELRR